MREWRLRRLSEDVSHNGRGEARLEGEKYGEIVVAGEWGWWLRMGFVRESLRRQLETYTCKEMDYGGGRTFPR